MGNTQACQRRALSRGHMLLAFRVAVVMFLLRVAAAQTPTQPPNTLPKITPGTSFQWQLKNTVDTSSTSKIYDIDVFDTPSTTISALKKAGHLVICYMSVGSYEDWRPDACQFPKSVRGKPLDKIWKGEWWLDVRQISTLGPIMKARMVLAVQKGCDGVEGDNVDGYTNDSGFPLSADDQVAYNRWLADTAHSLGLLVGLKNTMTLASQLLAWYDFALLEQCVQYTSCDLAKPFLNANKAVFDVEYIESGATVANVCAVTNQTGIDGQIKNLQLDSGARVMCKSNYTDLATATVAPSPSSGPEPTLASAPCSGGRKDVVVGGFVYRIVPAVLLFTVLTNTFI